MDAAGTLNTAPSVSSQYFVSSASYFLGIGDVGIQSPSVLRLPPCPAGPRLSLNDSLGRSRRSGESGSESVYTHLAGHARIILRWLRASSRYSPAQSARSRFSPDAMLQFRLHQCRRRRDNLPDPVSQQTI